MAPVPPAFVIVSDGRCSFCGSASAPHRKLFTADGTDRRFCAGCLAIFVELLEDDEDCRRGRARRAPIDPDEDAVGADDVPPLELPKTIAEARALVATFLCAFCGARRPEVMKLISGGGVFICDRCVDAATAIA